MRPAGTIVEAFAEAARGTDPLIRDCVGRAEAFEILAGAMPDGSLERTIADAAAQWFRDYHMGLLRYQAVASGSTPAAALAYRL